MILVRFMNLKFLRWTRRETGRNFKFTALVSRPLLAAAGAVLVLAATCVAAGAATARREAGGAIRYYDDGGFDRGYAWCLRRSGRAYSGWADCDFVSLEQCRASSYNSTFGSCEPNPFSYEVQVPPARPRRR